MNDDTPMSSPPVVAPALKVSRYSNGSGDDELKQGLNWRGGGDPAGSQIWHILFEIHYL